MKAMEYLILGVFAVIVLYYMSSTLQTVAEPSIALEQVNITANNTNVVLAHTPDSTYPFRAYFYNNASYASFPMLTATYLQSGSNFKVYTNGTAGYPNVTNATAGVLYYVSYNYQKSGTVFGLDLLFVAALVFIGSGIYIVYLLTKH